MLLCFQFISVTKNVREKSHIWHSICMHCCTSSGPSQTLPRSFLRAVWWWELGWASSVVPGIFLSSIPVPAVLHGVAQLWMVSKSSPEPWLPPSITLLLLTPSDAPTPSPHDGNWGICPFSSRCFPICCFIVISLPVKWSFLPLSPHAPFCLHKTWCCIVNNVGIHYINFPLISSVFPAVMESEQSNLSSPTCQITLYPLSIRTNVCKPLKS